MDSISQLLTSRRSESRSGIGRGALGISLVLHGLLFAGIFVVPALFAQPERFEYVDVELLPAAALNPSPRPATARPKPQPPAPEPEPEPERKPPPEDVPVLPADEPEEKRPDPAPAELPDRAEAPADDTPPELTSSTGAERASSSGIGPSSNVGFSDPEFQRLYNYYVDTLLGLIRRNWNPPPVGGDVQAILRFDIARNGEISGLEMIEESGLTAFDVAATRAVRAASPLPPLPRSYREDELGVTVRFSDRALSR